MKAKKVSAVGFGHPPFHDMVVFDLETTGLSSTNDEIIQIAAVRMIDGRIVEEDSFFSYIKPRRAIPSFITSYTGVTQRDVDQAPLPQEVLPLFSVYCKNSLLVAHNGKRFDVPFIQRACERHGLKTRETPFVDSMHLSWSLWGRPKGLSHSLDNVIARSRVSQSDIRRHDARGDVLVTARCIQRMMARLTEGPREIELSIHECWLPEPGALLGNP
jgi:DNA polymerase III epsilon subunit family exonuclease